MSKENNSNKIPSLEELRQKFILKPSWDFDTFKAEFGISLDELEKFDDLFCIADHEIYIYEDATTQDLEKFLSYLNDIALIEQNRILAEYIVMNDLSNEEIKELFKKSREFYQKLLTDKKLYDEVQKLIFESLKSHWGVT